MNPEYHNRIEHLRKNALCPAFNNGHFHIDFLSHFLDGLTKDNYMPKYAEANSYAFDRIKPVIDDGELIVGKFDNVAFTAEEQKKFDRLLQQEKEIIATEGQDSHMAIDYELLLTKGITGILQIIDEKLKSSSEPHKTAFYECCKECLKAVIRLSGRYADHALSLAENCTDSTRKAELFEISEICRRVPEFPAASFREAIQSAHFVTYCLSYDPLKGGRCQQFQLGHPDKYLYPYYQTDIQNGTLTKEDAQLLLDLLGIMINHRVYSGLSSGWMVGGRDRNGNIVANDLTLMCMQVVEDIRLVYPSVGLCHTRGMQENILRKACEILSHGRSHPAIFNDDVITDGLRSYGVPESDAHDYIHSTCVEITPAAGSNIWVASPYTNLPQMLLDLMDREYSSFEELCEHLFSNLAERIRCNCEMENKKREQRAATHITPLLSCFVNDCLNRGMDIEQGGARYNWILPSFVGVANLADSLYALKTIIFDRREMSMADMKKILDSDFEGKEDFRLRLLNALPKYGNDVDDVDQLTIQVINFITEECKKHITYFDSKLVPSVFCWVMHERFGRATGATPDGRPAGFPLGDGSGPCQGREHCGPTSSILSSTKWSHKELIGGVAVNMKFSKQVFTADSYQKMIALIQTYLERGGFEIQINVTDYNTLKQARENPENYRDLIVRIGGYSDYFVNLPPGMQDEVMLRTEHGL